MVRIKNKDLRNFCCAFVIAFVSACSSARSPEPVLHAPPGWTLYTVQGGDTLSKLAQRTGVSTEKIIDINEIEDPDELEVGQGIFLPTNILQASIKSGKGPLYRQSQNSDLQWPVQSGEIISPFGPRRSTFHDGLDIRSPTGAPIFAAQSGIVAYSGSDLTGYGNLIIIRGDSGLVTLYAHNSENLVQVKQRVKRGELIGKVGATGKVEGPHLHFEVRMKHKVKGYVAVDPIPFFNQIEPAKPRFRINETLAPILAQFFSGTS
jgi:murein DD-endopeptidase MepM/ murein hydrolase activator NlpD